MCPKKDIILKRLVAFVPCIDAARSVIGDIRKVTFLER